MTQSIDLSMHRALVTRAGQPVGRAIALTLAAAGAAVLVNDLLPERAAAVADEVRAAGGRARPLPFDVTDFAMTSAALEGLPGIDILVNYAGYAASDAPDSLDVESSPGADPATREAQLILYGVMFCTRACLPAMVDRRFGRIVTVIPDTAHDGSTRNAIYAGAKAGAAEFTRSTAAENGRYGITANIVALTTPDPRALERREFRLRDTARSGNKAALDSESSLVDYAQRRLGGPPDAATAVAFLVSPLGSSVTGRTIPVTGYHT